MTLKKYARIMLETENFPMEQFNKAPGAERKGRLNRSAKDLFKREFHKKYSETTIEFENENEVKQLPFNHVVLKNNAGFYGVTFKVPNEGTMPGMLHVAYTKEEGKKAPYIQQRSIERTLGKGFKLTQDSQKILEDMLKY